MRAWPFLILSIIVLLYSFILYNREKEITEYKDKQSDLKSQINYLRDKAKKDEIEIIKLKTKVRELDMAPVAYPHAQSPEKYDVPRMPPADPKIWERYTLINGRWIKDKPEGKK